MNIASVLGLPSLPSTSPDTIAALLWSREVIQKHIFTTYSVTDPKGIEELKPVNIGGVNQWIHIRGRNRNNPVLLFLHGGPGSPLIGMMDAIQRSWEDYFTVVHWDQRQTGKSYYPEKDESDPLTVDQFIDDTAELIQYLLRYLNKPKLFVLGSSWGSVLGMHMVKRYPERLYAYVGVGQVVNSLEAEKMIYARLFSHALEQEEHELIARLKIITPKLDLDYPEREAAIEENVSFVRSELSRLAGETLMHHMSWSDIARICSFDKLTSPHITLSDLSNSILGDKRAMERPPYIFAKEFFSIDLPKDIGSTFKVPIFFFTGSHDWQTPVLLSDKWFSEINSPHKELIHFEESSHCVVNEEPGKFLINFITKVLPFSKGEKQ